MKWADIKDFLTDDEIKGLGARYTDRIEKAFNALPDNEAFKIASLSGADQKTWYQKSKLAIEAKYKDDSKLFADIIASLSPQQSVELNFRMANTIFKSWIKSERKIDNKTLGQLSRYADLKCRKGNLKRAFKGQALSGHKVKNFAKNLQGDFNAVTIDTHMASFADISTLKVYKKCAYLAYTAKIRMIARDLNWKPCEVQASIWSYTYSKVSNCTVNAVPDFSKLLNV
jgi:hypothetical protein